MSIQALRDAFRAGFAYGFKAPEGITADAAFDRWYQDALEYLDREALPPASICPDNSHDYRVDDSDGLLKCFLCKKVLF